MAEPHYCDLVVSASGLPDDADSVEKLLDTVWHENLGTLVTATVEQIQERTEEECRVYLTESQIKQMQKLAKEIYGENAPLHAEKPIEEVVVTTTREMKVVLTYYSAYGAFRSTVNQFTLEPHLDAQYACNEQAQQMGMVVHYLTESTSPDGRTQSYICYTTSNRHDYSEAALNAYCQSKYGTQATGVAVAAFAAMLGAGWASGPIGFVTYMGAEEVCEAAGHRE